MAEAVPDTGVLNSTAARCWTSCLAVAARCSLAMGLHCLSVARRADALP